MVVALFPLAIVPVLVHLIAEGELDFGGGEKDLVWVLPWTLWSLIFAVCSLVLWRRGWSLWRATLRSVVVGFAVLILAAVLLGVFGQLGVAGRF